MTALPARPARLTIQHDMIQDAVIQDDMEPAPDTAACEGWATADDGIDATAAAGCALLVKHEEAAALAEFEAAHPPAAEPAAP